MNPEDELVDPNEEESVYLEQEDINEQQDRIEDQADDAMLSKIREDVRIILIPRVKALDPQFEALIQDDYVLHVGAYLVINKCLTQYPSDGYCCFGIVCLPHVLLPCVFMAFVASMSVISAGSRWTNMR